MFPCFHAFCLSCLAAANTTQLTAGTRVSCPLCNTAVIITSTGSPGLGAVPPGSLFLQKLLKLRQIFGCDSTPILACDICSGSDSYKSAATSTSKRSTR